MAFTGTEDQMIPLSDASTLTKNYRNTLASPAETIAHYVSKTTLLALLNQETCVGVRIYYALDASGKKQLVLVGVNSSQNDLYTGLIADKTICCPMDCGTSNPLNS